MRPATRSIYGLLVDTMPSALYESSTSHALHSYENRNDLGLIVLITGHGQIGVAAFSYLKIALLAAGHLSLRCDARFTSVGLVLWRGLGYRSYANAYGFRARKATWNKNKSRFPPGTSWHTTRPNSPPIAVVRDARQQLPFVLPAG